MPHVSALKVSSWHLLAASDAAPQTRIGVGRPNAGIVAGRIPLPRRPDIPHSGRRSLNQCARFEKLVHRADDVGDGMYNFVAGSGF